MNVTMPIFHAANAEIIVLALACVGLIADLFFSQRIKHVAYYTVQLTLLIVFGVTLSQIGAQKVLTFSSMFVNDDVARILKLFIYISAFAAFIYSRHYVEERNMPRGEYYILGLLSTLGMMVLVSAHSLLTIYIGLELLSLPLYAMVALQRDNAQASEAAMKYFVMGAIASGMMLYGMSMLYGATTSLDIASIANAVSAGVGDKQLLFTFALVFMVAGLAFKLAAAPFHMWAPDVYEGAPTSVTLFLSSAPKVAALGMTMRLLVFALPGIFSQWQQLLWVLSIFSIIIGNLIAIAQTNIKRMLAYSGIAHIGFMLFGLIAGTNQGYANALFYIAAYSIMSVAAFGLVVLLSQNGNDIEKIDDFKGLNQRSPWLAALMLIIMFSMAGVPPTVGFFAKLMVLKALVDAGQTGLAVFGVLFAVIGAFYYLRIIKVMYFDKADESARSIKLSGDMQLAISINSLALLALGLFPSALLQMCRVAFGL